MLPSYPQPPPYTWPHIPTRELLPVYPPPEPLALPELPSAPRKPSISAPYTLTTHIFPAAYLRTPRHVPVPSPPPENYAKAERQAFMEKTKKQLHDMRVSFEPQSVPQILWNCVNRYVRNDLNTGGAKGVTLFFAHANGFPKEIWEPTLQHLLSSSAGLSIDEVWTWESVQHGDACLINEKELSGIFDWSDNARDILNFLLHFLPSTITSTSLPTHLLRVASDESEYRKTNGFRERTFVAVGHSYGGCTSTLAALTHPRLFSSLILIDPVIMKPDIQTVESSTAAKLILGALTRRETWSSREEALRIFSKSPFFGAWDPEVLKIYIECGTYPTTDVNGKPIVRLKMLGIQEAIVFSETHTECEVYHRLPKLDERIELKWIMPGKIAHNNRLGSPETAQQRVWVRPKNSSNVCIPNAGHLIPQEEPKVLASEIGDFIQRRYSLIKANL